MLAQIKEEISILAADHRRKKPVEVPRPAYVKAARRPVKKPGQDGYAHAVGVLRRVAAGQVRVFT